jgi:cell division protein FtsI (penicillin-binding protein 3)
MGLKDAMYILESQGMNVFVKGKGTVVRQSVPAGALVGKRTPVVIELQLKIDKKVPGETEG